jgi:hypothetical protein
VEPGIGLSECATPSTVRLRPLQAPMLIDMIRCTSLRRKVWSESVEDRHVATLTALSHAAVDAGGRSCGAGHVQTHPSAAPGGGVQETAQSVDAAGSCSEMGAGTSAPRGGRGPPELFAELEDSLATRREYVHLNQHQVDDTCAEGSHSPSRKPPGLVHTCLGATSDCTSQPAVHTELWVTTGRHCGRTTLLEREPCRQGCGGASRW